MEKRYKRILLKLSGEALSGKEGRGLDFSSLRNTVSEVKQIHDLGIEIGIVVGGGNIFRGVNLEEFGIDRVKADYMGMLATVINCIALSEAFSSFGIDSKIMSAFGIEKIAESFSKDAALRYLSEGKILLFASGTGNPYFTTDTAAVLRALEIEADVFIKGTKVDGVYSDDPFKNPNAKFFDKISYQEFLEKRLKVLDLTAVSLAMTYNLPIIIYNMRKKGLLKEIIEGKKIGTLIKGDEP